MIRPTLFFLHALGSSRREWDEVIAKLAGRFDCVALDTPGFGDANKESGATTVVETVNWLAEQVRARAPAVWLLVGHSMGGKVATLLAARAEAAEPGLDGLAGVVLVAASPPAPEPMDEKRRQVMVDWFAKGEPSRSHAEQFVKNNTSAKLPPEKFDHAADDVQRANPHAWTAWLQTGSREDWSETVGVLRAPALIVAGADDQDLGEINQRVLNTRHYARATVAVVQGAAHLIPLEQPDALAELIGAHAQKVAHPPGISPKALAALLSARTSARTRNILLARLDPIDGPSQVLDAQQLHTLSALIGRILPGCGDPETMARALDLALAGREGDGWRFAELPPDAVLWPRALTTLDAIAGDFAGLPAALQDDWLARMARGEAGDSASAADERLSPAQMKLWFEDVRGDAVRAWMSNPQGMSRIGYDGFANGGDGLRKQGYQNTGPNAPEPWEPEPFRDAANAPTAPSP